MLKTILSTITVMNVDLRPWHRKFKSTHISESALVLRFSSSSYAHSFLLSYHDFVTRILRIIALCGHLVSLEVYDERCKDLLRVFAPSPS